MTENNRSSRKSSFVVLGPDNTNMIKKKNPNDHSFLSVVTMRET